VKITAEANLKWRSKSGETVEQQYTLAAKTAAVAEA
jgi:hypothetical protein